MATRDLCISQINLQHCIAASALHSRDLAVEQTDFSLLQEPWCYKGMIKGIDSSMGALIYAKGEPGPRAGIFVSKRHRATRLSHTMRGPHVEYRNPRATDWALYKEGLERGLRGTATSPRTAGMVEAEVDNLRATIIQAYEAACPAKQGPRNTGRKVPWWSKELDILRTSSRRLLNRALSTQQDPDWEAYKAAHREYKRRIKRSERESWRRFCDEMESLPLVAKLRRVFSSGPPATLDGLILPDGTYTEDKAGILKHMLSIHFPGSTTATQVSSPVPGPVGRGSRDWKLASDIVTPCRIRWAIDSFEQFKSPGADGISPALLQKGGESLIARLSTIFRACLAMKYIPRSSREVRVVFIPKLGKDL